MEIQSDWTIENYISQKKYVDHKKSLRNKKHVITSLTTHFKILTALTTTGIDEEAKYMTHAFSSVAVAPCVYGMVCVNRHVFHYIWNSCDLCGSLYLDLL